MTEWNTPSRRRLLQGAVAAGLPLVASSPALLGAQDNAPAGAAPSSRDAWRGLKAGVATYSLRGLKVEEAIEGIKRVDLKYASIKDVHLRLDAPDSWRKAVLRKFKEAGVTPISCGVINIENNEELARKAFDYAKSINVPVIVCSPDPQALPLLDKLVKEYDIKLAIHNHGPGDKHFPSPFDVMKAVEKLDQRVGLCIDVGHTAKCEVDPADAIRQCAGRLYDVHLKDVKDPNQRGPEVELGRGDLDVRGILHALVEMRYAYHVGFEHEKDPKDPLPGLAESVGYAKGILSGA